LFCYVLLCNVCSVSVFECVSYAELPDRLLETRGFVKRLFDRVDTFSSESERKDDDRDDKNRKRKRKDDENTSISVRKKPVVEKDRSRKSKKSTRDREYEKERDRGDTDSERSKDITDKDKDRRMRIGSDRERERDRKRSRERERSLPDRDGHRDRDRTREGLNANRARESDRPRDRKEVRPKRVVVGAEEQAGKGLTNISPTGEREAGQEPFSEGQLGDHTPSPSPSRREARSARHSPLSRRENVHPHSERNLGSSELELKFDSRVRARSERTTGEDYLPSDLPFPGEARGRGVAGRDDRGREHSQRDGYGPGDWPIEHAFPRDLGPGHFSRLPREYAPIRSHGPFGHPPHPLPLTQTQHPFRPPPFAGGFLSPVGLFPARDGGIPPPPSSFKEPVNLKEATLVVSQVPPDLCNLKSLKAHFQEFGELVNFRKSNPGEAHLTYATVAEAEHAMASTKAVLGNRFIKIK
jgi:hypothetical protein